MANALYALGCDVDLSTGDIEYTPPYSLDNDAALVAGEALLQQKIERRLVIVRLLDEPGYGLGLAGRVGYPYDDGGLAVLAQEAAAQARLEQGVVAVTRADAALDADGTLSVILAVQSVSGLSISAAARAAARPGPRLVPDPV